VSRYYYQDVEVTGFGGDYDLLYKMFSQRLKGMPRGLSFKQVHYQIGTPLGLTRDETREVLDKAIEAGYIEER